MNDDQPVDKPHHQHKWMPVMYATYFGMFKAIAERLGYALAIHGSFSRDMDLIAVPWIEHPRPHIELLTEIAETIGEIPQPDGLPYTSMGRKPHGRIAYTIPTGAGGYVDISVFPAQGDSRV